MARRYGVIASWHSIATDYFATSQIGRTMKERRGIAWILQN